MTRVIIDAIFSAIRKIVSFNHGEVSCTESCGQPWFLC
jgi:hypothetical protein